MLLADANLTDRMDLELVLDELEVSGRELARRMGVSPMWVSRRLSGAQGITQEDAARIRAALTP